MGRKPGSEADALNKAFLATVRAATGVIRFGLPFTRWRAGLKGRRVLEDFFRRELPAKRASQGDDLFTRLCHARTEDGEQFRTEEHKYELQSLMRISYAVFCLKKKK